MIATVRGVEPLPVLSPDGRMEPGAVGRKLGISRQAVAQRLRPIEQISSKTSVRVAGRNVEGIENHVILHELFGGGICEEPPPCWARFFCRASGRSLVAVPPN